MLCRSQKGSFGWLSVHRDFGHNDSRRVQALVHQRELRSKRKWPKILTLIGLFRVLDTPQLQYYHLTFRPAKLHHSWLLCPPNDVRFRYGNTRSCFSPWIKVRKHLRFLYVLSKRYLCNTDALGRGPTHVTIQIFFVCSRPIQSDLHLHAEPWHYQKL